MFDIGGPELLVILLGIIVLFGPKKIPEIAQMIGKGMQKVRSAQSQFKEQIEEIQTELKVVTNNTISPNNSPIKEINASELTENHFDNQNESLPENSTEFGFNPVNPKKDWEEPYNLNEPEKDSESYDLNKKINDTKQFQG
jgi:TatA/E family protein of Tat protein translocase